MGKLERTHHDERNRDGRYRASPLCDGCGKPVGTNYGTDAEVCGGTDGPGFFVCDRARCPDLSALSVEERRAHYTAQRAKNEGKR